MVSWYLCGILACLWHVCGMLAISYNALLHACSKNFSFFIIFLSHTHTHTRGIITRSEPRDPLVCIPLRFVPINTHTNTNTHTPCEIRADKERKRESPQRLNLSLNLSLNLKWYTLCISQTLEVYPTPSNCNRSRWRINRTWFLTKCPKP